jgi:hypothetical protein
LRGPRGYFDFIENIARKNSKKAKEALDWYGGPYDPDNIDQQQINITLDRKLLPTRAIKIRPQVTSLGPFLWVMNLRLSQFHMNYSGF